MHREDTATCRTVCRKYTQYDYRNQYAKLPRKERTQCGTDSRINGGKRDCPLEYSLRTKILTEKRISIPTSFCNEHLAANLQQKQNCIFYVCQRLQLFSGKLFVGILCNSSWSHPNGHKKPQINARAELLSIWGILWYNMKNWILTNPPTAWNEPIGRAPDCRRAGIAKFSPGTQTAFPLPW